MFNAKLVSRERLKIPGGHEVFCSSRNRAVEQVLSEPSICFIKTTVTKSEIDWVYWRRFASISRFIFLRGNQTQQSFKRISKPFRTPSYGGVLQVALAQTCGQRVSGSRSRVQSPWQPGSSSREEKLTNPKG
jgi:hypothetical protein